MAPKVAFVTGANGISGYAIVEELIRKPKTEWSKIVITSRSPLPNFWSDPRVFFVALDFLKPVEETIEHMKSLCEDVTHAFFASYVHSDDFKVLREKNEPLFQNFLVALETVATTSLQNVCIQTGGKHYGVHLGPTQVPLEESMGRYEDNGENFYYPQEDFMFERQKGKSWSYNIIRPNAIVGFTPGNTGMSQVLTAAIYFLISREIGEGGIFPGNKIWYDSVDDASFAPSIADLSIYASTHDNCKNEAFNHANGDVIVWRYFWPKIGKHFGLSVPEPVFTKATGASGGLEVEISMTQWASDKRAVWDSICEKYGGKKEAFDWATWGFFDWAMGKAWCSVSTVSKARKFGWTRYDDTTDAWMETFRSFENAGILPPVRKVVAKA